MASLRKKARSPFWFACFSLPDGSRTQRSTKQTERQKALAMALKWEEAARNRITEAQARRVLSDIHQRIHGVHLASPTVEDYITQWLGRKQGEVATVTHDAYRHATTDFKAFLGDRAADQLQYVTPAQIATWRDASARKATPRTSNNKLKIIRVLFASAWRDGLIADNPAAKVSTLKTADGNRRPFTLFELKRLLAVATTEWRGMVLVGFYTGQRLKDAASLTWANIDLTDNQIRLSTSKTGRLQVIPIAAPLRAYLEELSVGDDPTAPLFPSLFSLATGVGDSSPLSQRFFDIMVNAGIARPRGPKRKGVGKGRNAPRERNAVSFHSLRHTTTSLLKTAGVSEAVTRDIIGHDSAEVSRHYTHIDDESKRSAISRLPDITRP